jgi:DNA-binding transcriptional LysR family regulator
MTSEHLPKALAAFLHEHPDINVDVEERESADIAAAIATGAADLGFAAEHALPDNLERFTFSEDRLMRWRRGAARGVCRPPPDRFPGGECLRLRRVDEFDRACRSYR